MIKEINRVVFLLLLLFVASNVVSQEKNIGIHQLQAEEFRENIPAQSINKTSEIIIPIDEIALEEKELGRVVFGFLPDWEYSGAKSNLQYDALTHIAMFDWNVRSDGTLTKPSYWPWTDVINAAHAEGTKVLMTVTHMKSYDYDSNAEIHEIMTDPAKKNVLFQAIKSEIENSKLDGVNVDFEGFSTADRGEVINNFLRDLKAYLPGKEVSFDGPAINWGGWDFAGMVDHVDHIFIMAYDYDNNSTGVAQPVAPLYKGYSGFNHYVDRSLSVWYKDAIEKSSEKIILGVPYYGRMSETTTNQLYSTIVEKRGSTRYYEIDELDGYSWDSNSHTPWFVWQNSSEWLQVYMDDVNSLGEKYDMALDYNLGGIGIWALNYDRTRPELWVLIREKFEDIPSLSTEDDLSMNVNVYPNPVHNVLNVEVNGDDATVTVFSVLGEVIYESISGKINTESWDKGLYFVSVDSGCNRQVFRIVK